MDTPRNSTEKVRSILQAMERSIDSARNKRMQNGNTSNVPGVSRTSEYSPNSGNLNSPDTTVNSGHPGVGARPMMPPLARPAGASSDMSPSTSGQSHSSANGIGEPTDPEHPPRLKARPKRRTESINGTPPPAFRP